MMSLRCCLQVAAMLVLSVVCVFSMPSVPVAFDDVDYHGLISRDSDPAAVGDPDKPVREDGGLASLLLKNLRFRDLLRRQSQPMTWGLKEGRQFPEQHALFPSSHADPKGLNKRGGDVSVSELAQILNNLKSRNAEDDGVKLQSLRFGK